MIIQGKKIPIGTAVPEEIIVKVYHIAKYTTMTSIL